MTSDIHAYFENMGEDVVDALSRNWSEPLWTEAQVWLARRTARDQTSCFWPAVGAPATDGRARRRVGATASRQAPLMDALGLGSILVNLAMVLYLIH